MSPTLRLALTISLAATLVSCTLRFPLDIIRGGKGEIIFTTQREWKWFIIPHRPKAELCSIDVYDDEKYVWRVRDRRDSRGCIEKGIPIAYGATRPDLETLVEAEPLAPGRRYGVQVGSWESAEGNFMIPLDPKKPIVFFGGDEGKWVYDPDTRAQNAAQERRISELRGQGLTEDQAYETFYKERESGLQMNISTPAAPAAPASNATNP